MSIVPTTIDGVEIDRVAILRSLKLDPRDPKTQALILVCERYGLDPLLKHMVLVEGNPYVTRDGYLHIAHASGKFDGIEVVETGSTQTHWTARVSVYRKDMSRPITYDGRYPKDGANKRYGPEMAVKTAEVAALRRAFNVTGIGAADEQWDAPQVAAERPRQSAIGPASTTEDDPFAPLPTSTTALAEGISGLCERLGALGDWALLRFTDKFGDPENLPASRLVVAEAYVTSMEKQPPPGGASAPVPTPEGGHDETTADPDTGEVRQPLASVDGQAGTGRTYTEAQKLHIAAGPKGHKLAEADLRILIRNASGGRTDSANQLTEREIRSVHDEMNAIDVTPGRLAQIRKTVAEFEAGQVAS